MFFFKRKKIPVNRRLGDSKERRAKLFKILKTSGAAAGALLCFFVVLLGLYFSYQQLLKSSFFALKEINTSKLLKINHEEILELAEVELGVSILSLNLGEIEKKIFQNPWVKKVQLFRMLPNKIRIEILEKNVLAIMKKDGKLFYIEPNGEVIKEVTSQEGLDFPIITSSSTGQEEAMFFELALLLLSDVKPYTFFDVKKVSEIHLKAGKGLEIYTLPYGTKIKIGSQDLDKKLDRLEKVLADLTKKQVLAREIDLNFSKKVVVKTLKKP